MNNWHVVRMSHNLTPKQIIDLAVWCSNNLAFNTWNWGGGQFRFENKADAVQFALVMG